jgi:hypothetical protein
VFGLRDALVNTAYVLAFVSAGGVLAALGVKRPAPRNHARRAFWFNQRRFG